MLQARRSKVRIPVRSLHFCLQFTLSFQPYYDPTIYLASNSAEYYKILQESKADNLASFCEPII
jgi:hypothetical protein